MSRKPTVQSVLSFASHLARPVLLAMDPERAHDTTIRALEAGAYPRPTGPDAPELAVDAFGQRLPNPIGMAAGFDKDARVAGPVLSMGFGFAEVGTLTPRPQAGNPKPRVFRLRADNAIINRYGFNNAGHDAALSRLTSDRPDGCLGVNLGANKDSSDRVLDYVTGVRRFASIASYLMINISSPNTPGLRDLQAPRDVATLLAAVLAARDETAEEIGRSVPVAIKLAPDIADDDLEPILSAILDHDVAAIAISNTTIARPKTLRASAELIAEAGGLSGRPLFATSTRMLARAYGLCGGRVPLIGIGGVDSGGRAVEKIRAGASLVQVYTGFVYQGPGLLTDMKTSLTTAVRETPNADTVADLVGTDAQRWANAQP